MKMVAKQPKTKQRSNLHNETPFFPLTSLDKRESLNWEHCFWTKKLILFYSLQGLKKMIKLKLLGTSLLIATYSCFVTYVPSNPNLYKLTADTVRSICSFLACVTLQVYLASSTQQTILGGLCIQFLLTTEGAIMHFWTLSLVTNIAHEGFSTFYANNPEISKYVVNPKPLACCFCASLVMLSAARLLLIALPSYYQCLPRKTCLVFSAAFNVVILISDFLLNHVRCLLTHSKHYESADGEQMRIEFGISTQTLN